MGYDLYKYLSNYAGLSKNEIGKFIDDHFEFVDSNVNSILSGSSIFNSDEFENYKLNNNMVIVDESHKNVINYIYTAMKSEVTEKIKESQHQQPKPQKAGLLVYDWLMKAVNTKIIFLTQPQLLTIYMSSF